MSKKYSIKKRVILEAFCDDGSSISASATTEEEADKLLKQKLEEKCSEWATIIERDKIPVYKQLIKDVFRHNYSCFFLDNMLRLDVATDKLNALARKTNELEISMKEMYLFISNYMEDEIEIINIYLTKQPILSWKDNSVFSAFKPVESILKQ